MAKFSWLPIPDKRLGTVYFPLCDVEIQNTYGEWETFTFKVDSGADMTLMEENNYYSLGYHFDDIKEIEFGSIHDRKFSTIIGNLNMKIGGHTINNVPVAFSKKPIKTLLLGRLKIFDNFEICFDNTKKQTIIRHSSTES
jgi:gag-polyprotein putative aspartyl protease